MTEQEYMEKQQECGEGLFMVVRTGSFYNAYGRGAFALARATGYRVMRRPRKGGRFVLTTGFPASGLKHVLERIVTNGGKIEQCGCDDFFFSGVDGSEDMSLVTEQKSVDSPEEKKMPEVDLRKEILSFDLSRSTPMEAMVFIDRLQKKLLL